MNDQNNPSSNPVHDASSSLAEQRVQQFEQCAVHLRGVAYRLVGSLSDAEDILQEARLRWLATVADVKQPRAYLSQVVSRLSLDLLKSARVRREQYVGTWLPEPLVETQSVRLQSDSELAEDVTMALMLALHRLTPLERGAFLLHDVFEIPYQQVAETLERTEASVRQLAARARQHVREQRPRHSPDEAESQRVLGAFQAAIRSGDAESLKAVLAQDVVYYADGGGRVVAAILPIYGADRVQRFLFGLAGKYPDAVHRVAPCSVNGMPGYTIAGADGDLTVTALQIEAGRIRAFFTVRNPDKLRHLRREERMRSMLVPEH